jgi:hypothetical protein
MLKCGQVIDIEARATLILLEDEEAVAGHVREQGGFKSGDRLELGVSGPVIESEDVLVANVPKFRGGDEGEGGLTTVVGEEEGAGRGGLAPGATHRAAAEEGFGGLADEDLPDDYILREAAAGMPRFHPTKDSGETIAGLHHSRRWKF